jgi:hypothetical protein
MNYGTPPTTNN